MMKLFSTLLRGQSAAALEELADRHAMPLLDQQMRDAQASLALAQRALATAIAEDVQEGRRVASILTRIEGLEGRCKEAMAAGSDALALDAAEVIAGLEAERDAGRQAQALFASEIGRLRMHVASIARRMSELNRGRRMARVADAVERSRGSRIDPDALADAEATLSRLRDRQARNETADTVFATLQHEPSTEERLSEAGFGPPLRPTAAAILARLK